MKLRNYALFGILLFLVYIPNVFAAPYYYQVDSGNYLLCNDSKCDEVAPGASGVTFNLAAGQITYNGVVYNFDSVQQENYNNSMLGQTRMFYYLDENGRYMLCTQVGDCERYTFDQLSSRGAIITTGSTVTLTDGTTYYYNASYANTGDNDNNDDNDNDNNNNSNVSIDDSATCGRLKEPLMFIGNIVFVVKIAIPLVIIAFGMVDFFKAITGSKDEEIRKSAKSFALRVAAGVIIFFIPTVISVIFSLISSWADLKGEFDACQKCILNVRSCE